jgi:hypothetical protein
MGKEKIVIHNTRIEIDIHMMVECIHTRQDGGTKGIDEGDPIPPTDRHYPVLGRRVVEEIEADPIPLDSNQCPVPGKRVEEIPGPSLLIVIALVLLLKRGVLLRGEMLMNSSPGHLRQRMPCVLPAPHLDREGR